MGMAGDGSSPLKRELTLVHAYAAHRVAPASGTESFDWDAGRLCAARARRRGAERVGPTWL